MESSEIGKRLQENLARLEERIAAAADRAGRDRSEIRTIAVTKYVDATVVRELAGLGALDLGENRLQVATPKLEALADLSAVRWHFIGTLQTNKVRKMLNSFHTFHAVDRPSLVHALHRHLDDRPRETPLPVFLQVNISEEESKSGVSVEEAESLGNEILESPHLDWVGLMTMAPRNVDPKTSRPTFAGLREFRDRLAKSVGVPLVRLSMGMTNDFEVAIEEGATDLRLGRVLYEGLP